MKIICVDNYDVGNVPDKLVAENVNDYYGKRIVKMLNSYEPRDSAYYYRLVEDDYELLTIEAIYGW